jgi:hypothetical protein
MNACFMWTGTDLGYSCREQVEEMLAANVPKFRLRCRPSMAP